MKILILGAGGREHALAIKINESKLCSQLFIAPGNAGTELVGENINIQVNDFEAIAQFCATALIEMIVVGPEDPLVLGVYDYFKSHETLYNIIVIGPSQEAAQLEGSKAYAKAFMQRHNIPTAAYQKFTKATLIEGLDYIKTQSLPIVLKADGLAGGKGVVIAPTYEDAEITLSAMLQDGKFGKASEQVVIEQFLSGLELSVFALTDGKDFVLFPEAKDYKRIGEGDTGLNTGGMGAISPVPFANEQFMKKVVDKIVQPTINGLVKDNLIYHGFVFFGLIDVAGEPMVIEYNCRLGDPETEVVLPRLENDLVSLFLDTHNHKLNGVEIKHNPKAAATVFCVSGNYPEAYESGFEITELNSVENAQVYHAGTTNKDGKVVTAGGRVLAVTSLADNIKLAAKNSIIQAGKINYTGKYFRKDIGFEF
jgi:phosphoribosylamine---glycine ligase